MEPRYTSDTPIFDSVLDDMTRPDDLCTVCDKRPLHAPGSRGLGGALCLVCIYDL
jgi:hypothetical protein